MTGVMTALLAATSSKGSSGSGGTTFIIFLVLIAVVGYFLLIRPQKQKQRRQRQQQSQVGVGDEVLTVGGIVGRVIAVDADRVTILSGGETVGFAAADSDPTRLVLVRNAISKKVEPPVVSDADADGDDTMEETATDGAEPYATFGGSDRVDGQFEPDANGNGNGNGNGSATDRDDWSAEGAENEGTSP